MSVKIDFEKQKKITLASTLCIPNRTTTMMGGNKDTHCENCSFIFQSKKKYQVAFDSNYISVL